MKVKAVFTAECAVRDGRPIYPASILGEVSADDYIEMLSALIDEVSKRTLWDAELIARKLWNIYRSEVFND